MSVQVYIPTPFRRATKNADRVAVEAPDVKALLDELEDQFGALKGLVRNDQGEVHHHVNIYVNNEAHRGAAGARDHAQGRGRGVDHSGPRGRRARPADGGPALRAADDLVRDDPDSRRVVHACAGAGRGRVPGGVLRGVLTRADAEPPTGCSCPAATSRTSCTPRIPQRHPRDSRTAYFIDPKDLLAIGRREGQGYRVATIYHSHIDAGAYFSATDKQNALIDGEPAYPDATYVVVSVLEGRVADAAAFVWDPARATSSPPSVPRPDRMTRSDALFERAQRLIPGGVNSPVRAFRGVGGTPLFVARAEGARLMRRRRQAPTSTTRLLGAAHPRPRAARGGRGGHRGGAARHQLRRAHRAARSSWPS